ncbi:MAG: hypothetical protein F7C33_05995 [Desulfurococcales archaeon]|nr:hypothetical protein [Desulfurococcales archaeon]
MEKRDLYKDKEVVRKMAQLMMQGAVMLSETCPICGLPLFRLRNGDVVCPVHGKIILVSSEEEAREVEVDSIVSEVEHYAAKKVRELLSQDRPSEILEWLRVIEAGERIRELREKRRRPAPPPRGRSDKGKGGEK